MRANAPVSRAVAVVGAVLVAGGIVAASACALDTNGLGGIFATDGSVDASGFGDACPPDTRSDPRNCGACGHACPAQLHQLPTCTNATCGVECSQGFGDCNGDPADGCEVATGTDGNNCGACGRSCGGGACNAGLCQPTTLASGQQHPVGIAIDDQFVFWTVRGNADNTGELMRAKLDGTSPTVMVAGLAAPALVALDASSVFWTNEGTAASGYRDGSLQQIGKDGTCTSRCRPVVFGGITDPVGVAVTPDDTSVVIAYAGGAQLGRFDISGGGAQIWGTPGPSPYDVAVTNDTVFFTQRGLGARGGLVGRGPIDGGAFSVLASDAGSPLGIAIDDASVFAALNGDGLVAAIGMDGGLSALATNVDHPAFVAVDDAAVYFTAQGTSGMSNGVVAKVRKDGTCPPAWGPSCPAVLASGQGMPSALAVDARYVYWVNAEAGTVLKVVK